MALQIEAPKTACLRPSDWLLIFHATSEAARSVLNDPGSDLMAY